MRNVVPFKPPENFARLGIDWTRNPMTASERALREAYLTYEASCGPEGLVSLLLLAAVSRRCGAVASDLQDAADHAEVLLAIKLQPHRERAVTAAQVHIAAEGGLWS